MPDVSRPIISIAFALSLLAVGGCEQAARRRQARLCEESLQGSSLRLLIGTEGTTELCGCTVDRVAQQFPDAAERWVIYANAVNRKLESRGVLGAVADSAWMEGEGRKMVEFAAAHLEAVAVCSGELFRGLGGGAGVVAQIVD